MIGPHRAEITSLSNELAISPHFYLLLQPTLRGSVSSEAMPVKNFHLISYRELRCG